METATSSNFWGTVTYSYFFGPSAGLNLCRGERSHSNECPIYDIKQANGKTPVILELWGMQSTSSLPSLPGSRWFGVVALAIALSIGEIELFDIETECKQMT